MIIFRDIISDDEMLTDEYEMNIVDDCLYEVTCRYVTRKEDRIKLCGDDGSDDGDDDSEIESGLDLVLDQRLIEIEMDQIGFMQHMRYYLKNLSRKLEESHKSDAEFKESAGKIMHAVKLIQPKLKDCKFFTGQSAKEDAMIALLECRKNANGQETPMMLFFKHGLDHHEVETTSSFNRFIKSYIATVNSNSNQSDFNVEMRELKDKMANAVKLIFPKAQDCRFFTAKSPDARVVLLKCRDDANGEPVLFCIKHGSDI